MSRASASPLALVLFKVSAAFMMAAPAAATESNFEASAPAGFEDLVGERQVIVDAYFGGKKLGQTRATITPGRLEFEDASAVARLLPDVVSISATADALRGALASNASLVCSGQVRTECGALSPETAGIIFDEEQFRVDLFLNPAQLLQATPASTAYLEEPERIPTMISRFSATLSGSSRGDQSLHLQNRSIASLGPMRVQSDSSIASGSGLSFDNLTAQFDHRDHRFIGGLFWVPGSELAGRRKVVGIGATTQLDTRLDKTALAATPLSIFLQQSARVDVLVDGKIVSSQILPAGNRLVDTAALPGGSYELVLRIQEDGRPARTEVRFFSSGSAMAPLGLPQLSAFAGFLQTSADRMSVDPRSFFYQATAAYRLAPALALDASVAGMRHKAVVEAGASLVTRLADGRLIGLTSTSGDVGAAIRASTYGRSALSVSFDLRAVRSRDGRPLLPLSASSLTFSDDPSVVVGSRGTYVQGLAIVDYRLEQAALRLAGVYRRDGGQRATYNVTASIEAPLIRRSLWDIRLQAELRKSREDTGSFIGFRFSRIAGATSLSGTAGFSRRSGNSQKGIQFVGETQAGWQRQLGQQAELATDIALGRNADGTYARGGGYLRSSWINVRADALHQLGSGQQTTQFAATADAAIVIGGGKLAIGGRDPSDAAAIATINGADPGQEFDVLVDESVRGTIRAGQSLPLFLAPYSTYQMRLRPRGSAAHGLTEAPRSTTLYPGNVVTLDWAVTPVTVFFGRVVTAEGVPLTNADIRGQHGVSQTDDAGYFQIEAASGDAPEVRTGAGVACKLALPRGQPRDGYVAVGDVMCR